MKMEALPTAFFGRFSNTGIVADFLADVVSRDRQHKRYILFYSQQMLSHYVPLLLTELMRVYQLE